MFNPLLGNVRDLSDDDLMEKISTLQKKMSQAASSGMFNSVEQLRVVLSEHQEELNRRHMESIEKGKDKYEELIDVKK